MIRIGNSTFDIAFDQVVAPKWQGEMFVQSGSPHVGIQMIPPRGERFRYKVMRLDSAEKMNHNVAAARAMIGHPQRIHDGIIDYWASPYNAVFGVLDVTIESADVIPHASGHRNGASFDHTPASRLIVTFDLVGVPR